MTLLAGGAAVAATTMPAGQVRLEARAGDGDVHIVNSKAGQAIHALANIRPGTSATGSVTITNTGNHPGTLTLSKSNLVGVAGPNGGRLSDVLDLTVTETTGSPMPLYAGKLPAFGPVALGTIDAGEARTFTFVARFPDGGAPPSPDGGDNAYQGSAATVQYNWDAAMAPAAADPPDTTITAGPPVVTADRTATFSFDSSESGNTFECSLDGEGFSPCTSPALYSGLTHGDHWFAVRARDAAGNPDPTPATHAWLIDAEPPETAIVSAPAARTTATTARFEFGSSERGSTFECSIDGGPFAACESPTIYWKLARGRHTFSVRAHDVAGNTDATPATHRWTIQATPLRLRTTAIVRGRTVRLRPDLSRPASLDVRLLNTRGTRIERWRAQRPKGARPWTLRLASRVAPGRYTLVVRAHAGHETRAQRLRITVTAPAAQR